MQRGAGNPLPSETKVSRLVFSLWEALSRTEVFFYTKRKCLRFLHIYWTCRAANETGRANETSEDFQCCSGFCIDLLAKVIIITIIIVIITIIAKNWQSLQKNARNAAVFKNLILNLWGWRSVQQWRSMPGTTLVLLPILKATRSDYPCRQVDPHMQQSKKDNWKEKWQLK